MKELSKRLNGTGNVTVTNIPFTVNILEGQGSEVKVLVHGDEKLAEEIKIQQDGNKVKVYGTDELGGGENSISISGGSTVISGGSNMTIVSGGSISIRDRSQRNKIVIDGVDVSDYVNQKKGQKGSDATIDKVDVYIPKGSRLKVSKLASVTADVQLSKAHIRLSGISEFDFIQQVGDLNVDLGGQAEGNIRKVNGKATIDTSGQSNVKVAGNFTEVNVDTSGQSSVRTIGDVEDDYVVDTSGQSSCRHSGTIHGDLEKDCSGQSSFRRN